MVSQISIKVQIGDALNIQADVLALKYAQSFHGVDSLAADELRRGGCDVIGLQPTPGNFCLVSSTRGIEADSVLFVGVEPLHAFEYREIRAFGHKVLFSLASDAPGTRHVALTLHGRAIASNHPKEIQRRVVKLGEMG